MNTNKSYTTIQQIESRLYHIKQMKPSIFFKTMLIKLEEEEKQLKIKLLQLKAYEYIDSETDMISDEFLEKCNQSSKIFK